MQPELRYGVMVALGILVPSVQVRILVSQPQNGRQRVLTAIIYLSWFKIASSLRSAFADHHEQFNQKSSAF